MNGGGRREREFGRREGEILDAALVLFEREDWQRVTIEEIAAAAEIGKGTVYRHFGSKDEIHAALALRFHRRLALRLQTLGGRLAPAEELAELIRICWEEHAALAAGWYRAVEYCDRADFPALIGSELRAALKDAAGELPRTIAGILRRGAGDGTFSRRPLARMTFFVEAALAGAVRARAAGAVPQEEDAEYRDALVLHVLDGLAPATPAPARRSDSRSSAP